MKLLLLGMEWFPEQAGGSNRYFRQLLETLHADGQVARGVVIGPATGADGQLVASAANLETGIRHRLREFASVAEQFGTSADLVDVHFALYAFWPVVLGRLRGKPLVVHFQGPWADESVAAHAASHLSALGRRAIERTVYRRADRLVTLSTAFKRILVEQYGILPWRVEVIPPGVDLEQFSPGDRNAARSELHLDTEPWVACTVRRLIPRTGVDVLLRAWAHLERDGLLLVAGEGPDRSRLERLAAELEISESVRFLGGVSEERLVSVYRASDVSIVPSTALEGFGLVVLESLACGTPVVASDVGGLPEALDGLEPRAVVTAGDATVLSERLARPLPNRSACRATAERYSWDRALRRHNALYHRVKRGRTESGLRVVYLDHTARLSGAEIALLRLLPALEGVDAHVILGEDGPLVGRLLEAGVSVEVAALGRQAAELSRRRVGPAVLGSLESLQVAAYVLRLAAKLRRLRPDVVHTNSLKAAFYGGAAARLAGARVISHVHDRIADDYLPLQAVRLTRSVLARLPHAVVAPSQAVAETLGRPAFVVPCASGPLGPRSDGDSHRPLTVGIVGRIAPWKGQDVFIEAFARAFPSEEARAVIVGAPLFGSDDERYYSDLQMLAQRLGLEGRVRFAGFVEDVRTELAGIDVLVHASVFPEPFGQVVVEGMAAGIPVVAANAGGPAEIIDNGVNGILYAPGDRAALASALVRLGSDYELRQRLGVNARTRAADYAPSAVASRVRELYAEVTGRVPAVASTGGERHS